MDDLRRNMVRKVPIKTVEDKIQQLKEGIIFNLNMAELEGFAKYYSYIKSDVEALTVLTKAKRIRDRNADITEF